MKLVEFHNFNIIDFHLLRINHPQILSIMTTYFTTKADDISITSIETHFIEIIPV